MAHEKFNRPGGEKMQKVVFALYMAGSVLFFVGILISFIRCK
jgi:hypothetical protein